MAIRSAACRACRIAFLLSISMLLVMGITRLRHAATTAQSTPSTCRATACACSALMARMRSVLVLSIALSSLLPGAPCATLELQCVTVCCSVLQCSRAVPTRCSCATDLLQSLVASASFACQSMAMSLFMCGACAVFGMCLWVRVFGFVFV